MSCLKPESSFQSPQKSLEIGDFIGMESHIEFMSDLNDFLISSDDKLPKKEKPNNIIPNEYPPPVPSYSRPWGTNKYITSDGRLIIEQYQFDIHQQIHARRSNGRLRLNLATTTRHAICDSGEGPGGDEAVVKGSGEAEEEEVYSDDEVPVKIAVLGINKYGFEKRESSSSSSYSFFEMPGTREIPI